jgi:hypothetical protein
MIAVMAVDLSYPGVLRSQKILTDFDAFYISGEMFWGGNLNDAYHYRTFFEQQQKYTDTRSFMPWTYPPPFNIITAAIASLPIGISYFLFTLFTLSLYSIVLKRISCCYFPAVIIALGPMIIIIARCGQNGFLTGSLAGLFFLGFLGGRAVAGAPLGLMVIKPHLAVGMTLLTLISKRWSTAVIAAATMMATSLVSALMFGPAIWFVFINSVSESRHFLELGLYPLFRMTSLYATFHTLGATPVIAMMAQCVAALLAAGLIALAHARSWPPRQVLGLAALASVYVSPYNYDYDLAIFGVGVAFLCEDILNRARPLETVLLLFLSWITCGWGLFQSIRLSGLQPSSEPLHYMEVPSVSAVTLLLFILLIVHIIRRPLMESSLTIGST